MFNIMWQFETNFILNTFYYFETTVFFNRKERFEIFTMLSIMRQFEKTFI